MNLPVIEHNNTQQKRQTYIPVGIKVFDINAQKVICQSGSGGNSSMTEIILSEDDFEQL